MVSIEQLKILVAVVESQSLREAAARVYKTQPAVTAGIKQLESMLGLTLFERDGYRLALNSSGKVIYQKAQVVLAAHQNLLQTAEHFAVGLEERVSIAIEASFELDKVLPVLEQTQQAFPHTRIVLTQHYLSGATEQLMAHEADLAIAPVVSTTWQVGDVEIKPICHGQMLNVATPKLLARHPELTSVKQLINEYQVIVRDTGTATRGLNLGVQQAQRHWDVNDFATKRALIISGMGWGRLPEYVVRDDLANGRLLRLELSDYPALLNVEYSALRPAGKLMGPVAEHLWQGLGQAFSLQEQ